MIRRTTLTAATLATLLATAACGGTNGTPLDQPTDGAPAATAAAEPDDEPPGVRLRSCGLRVLPGWK